MNFRKLFILISITLILIYAAVSFWDKRAPETSVEKALLFPELSSQINDVKIVEIKGYEEDVILSHLNNVWVIQSSDNFPTISEKVKTLIIKLSELKIDSEKTKNPELYSRLAVEGPYDRATKSKLVSLLDESGELIVSIIIGKPRESNQAIPALYVRKPDEEQALLVLGQIDVSSQEKDWFEQEIINLDSAEIKQVSITHPGQSGITLSRADAGQVNFTLHDIPAGKKPQSEIILNRLGRLLEDVRANNVRSINSIDMNDEIISVRIESFRGLITNISLKQESDKYFARFQFDYIEPQQKEDVEAESKEGAEHPTPEQEIALLNQKISPWVFQIPKFKYDDMTTTLDKLIRD